MKWEHIESPQKRAENYVKVRNRLESMVNYALKTQALYCRTRKDCDHCPFYKDGYARCKMDDIRFSISEALNKFDEVY